jgi:UDP-N-acetyl-D-glucosamine dehydrogenase
MKNHKVVDMVGGTLGTLQSKFAQRTARVGVAGLGYVGLPLALEFARHAFRATGFEIDPAKVEKLQSGETYIRHVPAAVLSEQLQQGHFEAPGDFLRLKEMGAVIICVPTPLNEHRERCCREGATTPWRSALWATG